MKGTDRNQLCPCGSGKKRKRCEPHPLEGPRLESGEWTRPETAEERRQRRTRLHQLLALTALAES